MTVTPLFSDASEKRALIHRKAVIGVQSLFPIKTTKYTIDVSGITVQPKDFSLMDVKRAILEGKSLTEPVVGTLTLKDLSGKVLDKVQDFRLMSLPFFTQMHTFIIDGNAYSVGNQLRTKPGVYTRVRRNEVPEVAFNLAKGANFKITMDPESSVFRFELGTSRMFLYPLLKALGISDGEMGKTWGPDILSHNAIGQPEQQAVIAALYARLIPMKEQVPSHDINEKIGMLRAYFDQTVVDPETTKITLGQSYSSISGHTILVSSGKLLKVFRDEVEHDDRDSLEFQKIHSVDDFIQERLQKGGPEIVKKLILKFDHRSDFKGLRDLIPSAPFSPTVKSLVTQFTLSRTPDQINPLEIMDAAMKVTRLGEGGISDLRAVPDATRDLHVTHLGVLDPVRTPESSAIGVDIRAALGTAKDDQGNIYTLARDMKTDKVRYINTKDLRQSTVAFPNQVMKGQVDVIEGGKIKKVAAGKVDFQIPHAQALFGPSGVLVPFIDHMQGNRATMGSKQITQALPLKFREEPLVQVATHLGSEFKTTHEMMGSQIIKRASEAGTITKVTDEFIHLKGKSGKEHKISYAQDLPLNSKTYLHEDVLVKAGDSVAKDHQLTESNFTRNGKVALGRNAFVAYMPFHGENSNDAIVVSQSAAESFTSMHMYKKTIDLDDTTTLDKRFWVTQFPTKFPNESLTKIEQSGLPKKGSKINYGEPLILAVRKSVPSTTDMMLGKLHKSLINKFRDASVIWDHEHPGEVVDIVITPKRIAVTVKMEAPIVVGDKLSGVYGNKGVVSRILPDDHMPHVGGRPLDILLASTGVVSRINPGQILETALGKVAKKTGQTIAVDNFSGKDKLQLTKELLKKHGIKDKETVTDPVTGREIPNIMVGYQHIMKLFKSTDTNFGARGIGTYDINEQPVTGGSAGSKRLGGMELNALLAHGATNLVGEAISLKSQKNTDWWNAFKVGAPLPPVKRSFAVDKLNGMLAGAGIRVEHKGDSVKLLPMTDKDIEKISSGAITEPDVLRKKDLKPEIGGLFDPVKTGGLEGEKWSHIHLSEPIVKPIFMKPVASLLRMTETSLGKVLMGKGGHYVHGLLSALNLKQLKHDTVTEVNKSSGQKLDSAVKRLKFLNGLEKAKLSPTEAYIGQKLAVLPPKMRPVVPGPNNQLLVSDANHLYREVILADKKLKEMKAAGITHEDDLAPIRKELHSSVSALVGLSDPTSFKLRQQGKKGFVRQISGPRPSEGYFQDRIYGRPQDLSGRGTIAPDPSLDLHEIGLPEDTAWGIYSPFVIKKLVSMGYRATEAADHVEKKTSVAKAALQTEVKDRPVIFNRAPTLWRYGAMAAYPKLIPGKTIRLSPFVESPMGADYDGDSVYANVLIGSSEDCESSHFDSDWKNATPPVKEGKSMPITNPRLLQNHRVLHIKDFPRLEATKAVKENGNEEYDVPPGTTVLAYNRETHRIEEAAVSKFSIHKGLEAFYVETNRGRSAIFSKDRSIFAVNPETLLPEETPTQKSKGRLIPRLFGKRTATKTTVNLLEFFTVRHKDVHTAEQPLTYDFGWLLGLFVGEGWGTTLEFACRKYLCVAAENEKTRSKAISEIAKISSRKPHIRSQRNAGFADGKYTSVKVTWSSSDLGEAILNLHGKGADSKHLPEFFMDAPEEFRWGLLAGLIDGDGTFSRIKAQSKKKPQYMCMFHSSSDRLIDEVSLLASSLGIDNRVTAYTGTRTGTPMRLVNFSSVDLWQAHGLKLVNSKKAEILASFYAEDLADGHLFQSTPPIIPVNPIFLRALAGLIPLNTKRDGFIRLGETFREALVRFNKTGVAKIRRRAVLALSNLLGLEEVMALPGGSQMHHAMLHMPKPQGWDDISVPESALHAVVKRLIPPKDAAYRHKVVVRSHINKKLKDKNNYVSRYTIEQALTIIPRETLEVLPFGKEVLTYYDNKSVRWDVIEKIEKLPERMDLYDLTVPGYDTFMLANQLIAYDTVQLHVPVSAGSVKDAKAMTPDKFLFSEKTRNDLIPKPEMEAVIGLYEATRMSPTGKKHKFKTREEAMQAYYRGELKPNDDVEVGS